MRGTPIDNHPDRDDARPRMTKTKNDRKRSGGGGDTILTDDVVSKIADLDTQKAIVKSQRQLRFLLQRQC